MERQRWSSPSIASWIYLLTPFEGKAFRNLSEYETSVLQSRELYVSFLGNKCRDSQDTIICLSFINALKPHYYFILSARFIVNVSSLKLGKHFQQPSWIILSFFQDDFIFNEDIFFQTLTISVLL